MADQINLFKLDILDQFRIYIDTQTLELDDLDSLFWKGLEGNNGERARNYFRGIDLREVERYYEPKQV